MAAESIIAGWLLPERGGEYYFIYITDSATQKLEFGAASKDTKFDRLLRLKTKDTKVCL